MQYCVKMKVAVYTAFAIASLDGLAFSMVITTIDTYVYSLGGTQFFLGVLGSSSALLILLCNPIVGNLSDRLGRRKVLQYSMVNCIIANLMTASISSLPVIFISRLLAALSCQNMSLVKSFIDDNITESKEEKDRVMNQMQAVGGMQFIIGALIAGYMTGLENGANKTFYFITVLGVINLALVSTLEKKQIEKTKDKQKSDKSIGVKDVISQIINSLINVNWSKYWILFTIKLLIDISFNINYFNLSNTLMNRYGLSGQQFGYVFAVMSIIGVLSGLAMIKLKNYLYVNDKGFVRILHVFILLLLSSLASSLAPNFIVYFVSLVPLSIARTLNDSTMTEMVLSWAAPSEKGSIMGTFDNTMALAGLIVPLMAGIITKFWGVVACDYLSITLCVLGLGISFSQQHKLKSD